MSEQWRRVEVGWVLDGRDLGGGWKLQAFVTDEEDYRWAVAAALDGDADFWEGWHSADTEEQAKKEAAASLQEATDHDWGVMK